MSLIDAPFVLHEKHGLPIPGAIALVSSNIADMLSLDDRGTIEVGRRADLIHVKRTMGASVIRQVWRAGQRVN
ncbi:MAG: amidohydrolase family protein [Pseudomonadota bacterium]